MLRPISRKLITAHFVISQTVCALSLRMAEPSGAASGATTKHAAGSRPAVFPAKAGNQTTSDSPGLGAAMPQAFKGWHVRFLRAGRNDIWILRPAAGAPVPRRTPDWIPASAGLTKFRGASDRLVAEFRANCGATFTAPSIVITRGLREC